MKKTILIIDDYDYMARLLEIFLRVEYDCIRAKNGQEAIDMLKGGTIPDLILCDMMMPVMDGEQFLTWIKSNEMFKSIPVFMVTGLANPEAQAKMYDLGAEGYILKPFNPTVLKAQIRNRLEQQ
jgi:CheY-like chemotaxis protein